MLMLSSDEKVDEAFAAFGVLRSGLFREICIKNRGKGSGIDHLVLSFAWMDGDAVDDDIRMGGVEVLIGDLFAIGTIDGIGESGPEFLCVEVEWASADFFIDREGEADWVVLNLRVALVIGKDGHDDGDAGFIVSAQQSIAIGDD